MYYGSASAGSHVITQCHNFQQTQSRSRNYKFYRNGNFCKGTHVSKIIMGAKFDTLVIVCIVKTAAGVKCLCFTSRKIVTVFGFLCCLSSYFIACVATDRSTQRLKRQALKTYTAVLFQIGVENSQKILAIASMGGKNCQVFIPVYL